MIAKIFKSVFGSRNERVIKRLTKNVEKINQLEPEFQALTDQQLRAKTDEFRQRIQAGESLDSLLTEAFAAVREASSRTLKMRHFDVQLIGGMVLHEGNIAEMLTGEGKTLVATLPAYLNALTGKGVHIITVNDYLAKRDASWMEPIYNFLGMTVGVNIPDMSKEEKQAAYKADITYGTNNEFGFDFLRDNMVFTLEERAQRGLHFAIVDEVDSILIDEARTPLIISGPSDDSSGLYIKIDSLIPKLSKREEEEGPGDFYLDEKSKQAYLTDDGHQRMEELLVEAEVITEGEGLYDPANITLLYHITAALRAHALFQRDVDYIVKDNEVIIVDEHTGRLMSGRRWSDGLHQAVEAKEKVQIQTENQTLASITFQNYFRTYEKLAGMTGTADTEAYEFHQIYGLEVVAIPPNVPVIRKDLTDKVYVKMQDKFKAIVTEIKARQEAGQPVLVGTTSIEASELLSKFMQQQKIKHAVLNAKQHEREAYIIAEAGRPGVVTIATNMAGRGTDIVLGGCVDAEIAALNNPTETQIEKLRSDWQQRHQQVVKAGGLHVLGTERHESRRIDNQLRGRSGRQGDPGSSQFYLSLEDNLLRIFAADRLSAFMQKFKMEDEAMEHPWLTRVIENAQRKVEGHNFDIRKQLLEFDNVANDQRKVVYEQRSELMQSTDVSETIQSIMNDVANAVVSMHVAPQSFVEQWDLPGLEQQLEHDFGLSLPVQSWLADNENLTEEEIRSRVHEALESSYKNKLEQVEPEAMRQLEKSIVLQSLDMHWKEHLAAIDHLRQGIHLRGYAQKNPKQEYKREAFELFSMMLNSLKLDVIGILSKIQIQTEEQAAEFEQQRLQNANIPLDFQHGTDPHAPNALESENAEHAESSAAATPFVRHERKVGRNEPCPCGSGKKYKVCHGKITA